MLDHTIPPGAIARIDHAGVYLRLARAAFDAALPMANGMASTTEAQAGERFAVPLAEEHLAVGTRQVQTGEVAIDKRVVEEQVMVPVTVRREEVEIIRRAPGEPREEVDDPSVVEVIRIPLRGEVPEVTTRPVVTGEVVVERTVEAEEQLITRTVRSTEVTVEEHLDEVYARTRPAFEEHFARRQQLLRQAGGATFQTRQFSDAEPHYRAGFIAGRDGRYAGRGFEEVEPELRRSVEPAGRDPGLLEQVREEVREGFVRARNG